MSFVARMPGPAALRGQQLDRHGQMLAAGRVRFQLWGARGCIGHLHREHETGDAATELCRTLLPGHASLRAAASARFGLLCQRELRERTELRGGNLSRRGSRRTSAGCARRTLRDGLRLRAGRLQPPDRRRAPLRHEMQCFPGEPPRTGRDTVSIAARCTAHQHSLSEAQQKATGRRSCASSARCNLGYETCSHHNAAGLPLPSTSPANGVARYGKLDINARPSPGPLT